MNVFPYPEQIVKRPPQQVLKEENARRLFRSVMQGQTSRAELAREHALSPTTVSALTEELIRGDLLTEVGEAAQTRAGRRPTLLEVRASGGSIGVVQVRDGGCSLSLCDLRGRLLSSAEETVLPGELPEDVLGRLISQARTRRLRGICLIPVDRMRAEREGIYGPEKLLWNADALREASNSLRLPILVGDPASLAVSALASPRENLLYLRFDESIWAGLVLEGRCLEFEGRSPRTAHLCVDPDGPVCCCGGRGCLRTYWDREVLLEKAGARDWDDLCAAYQSYEPTARAAMAAAAVPLVAALGSLCCLFPARLAILDGLEGLGEGFLYVLRKQLGTQGDRRLPEDFELRLAPPGRDLTLSGAVNSFLGLAMKLVD